MKANSFPKWPFCVLAIAWIVGAMQGCVPQPRSRESLPPTSGRSSPQKVPRDPPLSQIRKPPRTPLPQEAKIREQDLKVRSPVPPPANKETTKPPVVTPEATTTG